MQHTVSIGSRGYSACLFPILFSVALTLLLPLEELNRPLLSPPLPPPRVSQLQEVANDLPPTVPFTCKPANSKPTHQPPPLWGS